MNHDWVAKARQELLALGGRSPGWGYQPRGTPSVEPTALACLALAASEPDHPTSDVRSVVRAAAEWLATMQQSDGSLGVSAKLPTPNWPTPYAVLLWATQAGWSTQQEKAASWLLNTRGTTFPRDSDGPNGHDSTLAGWPWVAETHSWLEPTALAVLALRRVGLGEHPRTSEGVRLILDRAIETGGWNYGNSVVFGTNLRPQPGPTGLALTALSGEEALEVVERACCYLESALPNTRSAQSLCWGLLGLTAWGRRPSEADRWLMEGYGQAVRRSDRAPQLAYLLLAFAKEQSLHLLGIKPQNEKIADGSKRG